MSKKAHVGSLQAISELRGHIIKASESICRMTDECMSEVHALRQWLEGPQQEHWKRQVRLRNQKLASARGDLERAKIARPDADPRTFSDQQREVNKATKAMEEAEQKVRAVQHWQRELEQQVMLFRGGIQPLVSCASIELPKAARWLHALTDHLEGYVATKPNIPEASDVLKVQDALSDRKDEEDNS